MYSDSILLKVEKPGRYVGNEINMIQKNPDEIDIRFAFCFPDVYEVGMSHNGLQILYAALNSRANTYCERAFAPWPDMEALMRQHDLPLKSLETYTNLDEFDIIGFTLQYELTYTNILNMLDLAQIPLYTHQRGEEHPLVCGGGPCAVNPEPLADFFDFFFIGEAELAFNKVLDAYTANKATNGTKRDFLEQIAGFDGVYVPSLYDVQYDTQGIISHFAPNSPHAPAVVTKAHVADMDAAPYPEKPLVPLIETVHNRAVLEIFRGCVRGCRFCQAGFIYRPQRHKSAGVLFEQAKALLASTGHDEISLLSLATNDYPHLDELTELLVNAFSDEKVSISLPSLRIDATNSSILERVQSVRKSSLTFAPEGGSQRIRDVINKNLTFDDIRDGALQAFERGWDRLKLYFIVGLPTEEDNDLAAIGDMAHDLVEAYYTLPKDKRKRPPTITVSTSCFVPKPHTPFQWFPQHTVSEFMAKQRVVKDAINSKRVNYKYHDADSSVLEGVLSRGDRRLGVAIHAAWTLGARFDGWSEHFKADVWQRAFEQAALSPDFYAHRRRNYDEILPWDFINVGVSKDFLMRENNKAEGVQ